MYKHHLIIEDNLKIIDDLDENKFKNKHKKFLKVLISEEN